MFHFVLTCPCLIMGGYYLFVFQWQSYTFPVNNVQANHQPKMLRVIHQMITRMQMVMMTGRLLRAL